MLSQLLELGTARLTASQVLDLAGTPAVRRRFGFDDDELERLRDWTVGAGVRWGLDARPPRAPGSSAASSRAPGATASTGCCSAPPWRARRDGYGDVVPLDDVDSSDIDLAGRLAELVDRLDAAQAL